MKSTARTLLARLAVLGLGTMCATAALAAPVTLYSGGAGPVSEGWTLNNSGSDTQVTGAGTTQFTTVNNGGGQTSQWSTYAYGTGATDYIAAIRLQVLSSSQNFLDAGLAFSAFGTVGTIIQNDRVNSLMIVNGSVLWGDQGGNAAVANSTGFHDYVIRYLNGTLDVFFDESLAAVQAGTANSILTRTTAPAGSNGVGTIVFGDATNDPNFNSSYIVDYVDFQDLNAPSDVPEPAMLGLFGIGAIGLGLARRRKA